MSASEWFPHTFKTVHEFVFDISRFLALTLLAGTKLGGKICQGPAWTLIGEVW